VFLPGPPAALRRVERADLGHVGQVVICQVIGQIPPARGVALAWVNLGRVESWHRNLSGAVTLRSLNICNECIQTGWDFALLRLLNPGG
jgi:hypothetical protein